MTEELTKSGSSFRGGDLTIAGAIFLINNLPREHHFSNPIDVYDLKNGIGHWGETMSDHTIYVAASVLSLAAEQVNPRIAARTTVPVAMVDDVHRLMEPAFNLSNDMIRYFFDAEHDIDESLKHRLDETWAAFSTNPGGTYVNPYHSMGPDEDKTNPVFWGRVSKPVHEPYYI